MWKWVGAPRGSRTLCPLRPGQPPSPHTQRAAHTDHREETGPGGSQPHPSGSTSPSRDNGCPCTVLSGSVGRPLSPGPAAA